MTSSPPPVSALTLTDVTKAYRLGDDEILALDNVSLTVAQGEIICLLGPSGSGKTTLCSVAGGLLSPTTGTVSVGGDEISSFNAKQLGRFRSESVGFVFQAVNLVPAWRPKPTRSHRNFPVANANASQSVER